VGGQLRVFFITRALRRALGTAQIRDGVVLDFPCGSGVVAAVVAGVGLRCVGADLSLGMLRFAGAQPAWRGNLVCADITQPPFRSNSVAAVVSLRFFAHLPLVAWPAVFRQLAALTHGPLIIGLPMRRSSKHRWRSLKRFVGLGAKDRPIFDVETLRRVCADAGIVLRDRVWQSPFTDTGLLILVRNDAVFARDDRNGDPPARTGAAKAPWPKVPT
jgi:SAM-dependent methyltransferase